MKCIIIAAIGKNNELGKDNNLIWRISEDLKFFKEKTTNHTIVMGRKTFESLPGVLPNRHHIVITRGIIDNKDVETFNNIEDIINKYKNTDEEIFIIGGASIYKLFIDYADSMYLTEIDGECKDADAYFPTFNKQEWEEEELSEFDEPVHYKHLLYKRK